MNRLALLAIPLLSLPTAPIAADLDGPGYSERDVVIEHPAPPRVVERERIIERHYYEPAPVYREERVYVEPRVVYGPRYYDEAYYGPDTYAYAGWRPHYFFSRRAFWHRHGW